MMGRECWNAIEENCYNDGCYYNPTNTAPTGVKPHILVKSAQSHALQ